MADRLSAYLAAVRNTLIVPWRGSVLEANGQALISDGPACRIGEACEIRTRSGEALEGQIVGFERERALIMLIAAPGDGKAHTDGLRGGQHGEGREPRDTAANDGRQQRRDAAGAGYGDEVIALGHPPRLAVSEQLLGRVVNARAEAIDGGAPIPCTSFMPLDATPPAPFSRVPINELLSTGVRALDGMMPIGKGQRIGIFGGSGVGKSTLLGMITRNCNADVVVIGLVGERGREVLEFLNESLGTEGRARSVVVVGTSDEAPLLKVRAALSATGIAEHFASQGKQVLLIVDSLTRFAMAAREVGLAAGEPPTSKGYTPSVFSQLARMVERAGRFTRGSITAFYTVLMEGDDEQDPIVDAVRSFVDGHIMLSRDLAHEGWYPPIDILRSVSRLMTAVATPQHLVLAAQVRKQLALYARSEDLIRIGAYKPGSDPDLDRTILARPLVRSFLGQNPQETFTFEEALQALKQVALRESV